MALAALAQAAMAHYLWADCGDSQMVDGAQIEPDWAMMRTVTTGAARTDASAASNKQMPDKNLNPLCPLHYPAPQSMESKLPCCLRSAP